MNQQLFASQTPLSTMRNGKLVAPQLYLSSAGAGWEGLVAQAYHEPIELDGWISPATPDISLILFRGGAMHLAQRHANGPWRAFDIGQGDLILRAPGRASYEVRWKSHSSTPAQTLHLHLSHQLVARAAEQLAGHDPTRVALLARVGFRDPVLAQIGLALWRELEQPDPAGKLYAQTAAQMLAVHLLRHYPAGQVVIKEPAQALTQQQIRRVSDYVQAHLGQDISLEALAQQAGFSPYYFARLFRRTTGESPHQYVLRQRIECAQRLLGQRDVPLAQVALASGFANQSHFTRAFKRHLGLTPRAYRQDRSICADF